MKGTMRAIDRSGDEETERKSRRENERKKKKKNKKYIGQACFGLHTIQKAI